LKLDKSLQRYAYDENGKVFIEISGERYSGQDFEEIRRIICEQNMVEIPDENVSKEVRDSLEKAKAYKARLSGAKPASIEDYIISLATVTGWTMEYVHTMSVRKFIKAIRRLDNYLHYKIYLSASMSGMVEFKDKSFIKHWLVGLDEENKFDDVSLDLTKVQETISMEGAKS
jgi:hypothetical protein